MVVPQPTCAYVLKKEYPDFLGTDDARLVAENTFDVAEYLMAGHKAHALDTDFTGKTYDTITWHAACHYRAQQIGPKSRDLMALTGAKVTMVERCSAIDGTWGLRAENVEMARKIAKPLMEAVSEGGHRSRRRRLPPRQHRDPRGDGQGAVAPDPGVARAYGLEED